MLRMRSIPGWATRGCWAWPSGRASSDSASLGTGRTRNSPRATWPCSCRGWTSCCPRPYAEYGSTALTKIVPTQRWGIPSALAGEGWVIRFKGGWRGTESGQLVHQIAHLRRGEREVSLAVLTDGNPTMRYGIETVGAVAAALLRKRGAGG